MKNKALAHLFLIFLSFISFVSQSAVILQYHHVSADTPKSTSITPEQFAVHMKYLADNSFRVIPLNELIDKIQKQQPIDDKTVVITFDDAYLNILTNAKPILDQYNYPFTIFVNPGIVTRGRANYLNWQQLKAMSDDGVLIANHGYEHDSLARVPDNMTEDAWLTQQGKLLVKAEEKILKETGQSWKYFAYPYGEYSLKTTNWLTKLGFVGFSQQSGAVGLHSDLALIPRFPASQPYDKLSSLRDKLNSLPMTLTVTSKEKNPVVTRGEVKSVSFSVTAADIRNSQLNCYVSGIGKQKLHWFNEKEFSITFSQPLPRGRVRANCTAPSKQNPGRYYWYSHPWFVLEETGKWYPL